MSGRSSRSFILGSGSPRRLDLLRSAGFAFEVVISDQEEAAPDGQPPGLYARQLALSKGRDVSERCWSAGDRRPVLAADTVVVVDDAIIGKPPDRAGAREMLRMLSGRTHQVVTGFCVLCPDGAEHVEAVTTDVRFKPLRDEEIEAYLDTGEWTDKAGGYAVQGRAAYMVAAVTGSYTNVVGLPLAEAVEALHRLGVARAPVTAAPGARTGGDDGPGR